jgi:hypothetical protein
MDVDKPQGDNSSSHGKSVSLGLVENVTTPIFAVMPINPNLTTLHGKKIVEALQANSPIMLAGSSVAGSSRRLVQRPASSSARLRPPASPLGQSAPPAECAHVGSPPARSGRSPMATCASLNPIQLDCGLVVPGGGAVGLQHVGCPSPLEVGAALHADRRDARSPVMEAHGVDGI